MTHFGSPSSSLNYIQFELVRHVRHDSFICATRLICLDNMNHSQVRHDAFICVTSIIYDPLRLHWVRSRHDLLHRVRNECTWWLIHMWNMTHSYVRQKLILIPFNTYTHTAAHLLSAARASLSLSFSLSLILSLSHTHTYCSASIVGYSCFSRSLMLSLSHSPSLSLSHTHAAAHPLSAARASFARSFSLSHILSLSHSLSLSFSLSLSHTHTRRSASIVGYSCFSNIIGELPCKIPVRFLYT